MNGVRSFCWLVMLTAVVLVIVGAAWAKDEETQEYRFSPGKRLEIELKGGGSVAITGWDQDGAKVTYFDTKRDVEDHKIKIREKKGGLTITSEMIRGRNVSHNLTFEIRVPRKVDLEFYSMGGGLELEGLEGTFEGKTMGGSLRLVDVHGEAHIRSMGGEIRVSDCRLDGRLSTGGGEVLLENVVGDLEASSGGGDVQYRNVRDRDGRLRAPGGLSANGMTEETVVITTAGGPIHVRGAPEGARLQTGGGEIWVRDASRFVEAWTGGGDIWILVEDGWVKAGTGAGDIDVEIEEGLGDGKKGIELWTGTGDVTVTLPKGLSLDLDLEIAYTRNSRKDYRIYSDWDMAIEYSTEWDYGNGSPRKYIWGTASVEGGLYEVKIRTVNGHIRIEKAE